MVITIIKIPGYLFGGWIGDFLNYKKIAIILPIICGGMMLLCNLFIFNKVLVIVFLSLSKFMSGIASPSNVKIMDGLTNEDNKKEVFAQAYMSTNIGMAIASLSSGYLFSVSYSLVFIIDGLTRILSGLILLFIHLNVIDDTVLEQQSNLHKNGIIAFLKKQNLCGYIFITEIFIYIYSQYSYAIPLELNNLFEQHSENIYSMVLFVNCVTVIVSTPIMKNFSKKIDSLKCIQLSFVLILLGFCMYYFKLNIIAIIISTILWSLGEVLFGINELIYISQHTVKNYFARTVSIYDSLQNIIIAIAPMINSFYISKFSLKMSWLFIGMLSIMGAIYIWIFQKKSIWYLAERQKNDFNR